MEKHVPGSRRWWPFGRGRREPSPRDPVLDDLRRRLMSHYGCPQDGRPPPGEGERTQH